MSLTAQEAQIVVSLIKSAPIKGAQAETVTYLIGKINSLVIQKDTDGTENQVEDKNGLEGQEE